MKYDGIDVSKHQGVIDWSKVKTDFAILRAGFGRYTSQKDPMFERNYAGAKAAGIPVGAYWYSYARSAEEAREEAKACLQVLQVLAAADLELAAMAAQAVLVAAERCLYAFTKIKDLWFTRKCLPTLYGA